MLLVVGLEMNLVFVPALMVESVEKFYSYQFS